MGFSLFMDSYKVKWQLQDDDGNVWWEHHYNMSLSDWEELYRNNTHVILEVEMKLNKCGE